MNKILFTLLGLIVSISMGADSSTRYHQMGKDWGGTCRTGRRQSPIDIPTEALAFF